jgi:two-component system, CitB family, response regulator MalR
MAGKSILLVDDDKVSLLISKNVIQTFSPSDEFAEILTRDRPMDGLVLVQEYLSTDRDLFILLDINIPILSGWDFLDRLQELDPSERISVIMLTSSVSELDKGRAKAYSRVLDFFSKPLDESLVKRLLNHLRSKKD